MEKFMNQINQNTKKTTISDKAKVNLTNHAEQIIKMLEEK
jgi:hypothetical protein